MNTNRFAYIFTAETLVAVIIGAAIGFVAGHISFVLFNATAAYLLFILPFVITSVILTVAALITYVEKSSK